MTEDAFLFPCEGENLVGIVARPGGASADVGVLIVVGGPQYRVGSHRMFTQLARHLAREGFPSMRFDVRGMGDATGDERGFEDNDADIRAAVDAFFERVPSLRFIVLWGLCDGASACCTYDPADVRVQGAVLLNPWVRTRAGEAKTTLKHYYARRLVQRKFWAKLLTGGVSFRKSLMGLSRHVGHARGGNDEPKRRALSERMAYGLVEANRRFWLILSEHDGVAREFDELALKTEPWTRACDALLGDIHRLAGADHTVSRNGTLSEASDLTAEALRGLAALIPRPGAVPIDADPA